MKPHALHFGSAAPRNSSKCLDRWERRRYAAIPVAIRIALTLHSMSASNRAISRLPLSIFTDLITPPPSPLLLHNADANDGNTTGTCSSNTEQQQQEQQPASPTDCTTDPSNLSPEELRRQISIKLRDFHQRQGQPSTIYGATSKPREGITTVGRLLLLSPSALLRAVDPLLTNIECRRMIDRISRVCSPRPRSALELLQSQQPQQHRQEPHEQESQEHDAKQQEQPFIHISSGMENLDQCLRGGFRVGSITEVVGRAGVGKSQLVTQLCIMAARQGRGSVYIDTERKVSLRRMKEMAQERRAAQLGGDRLGGSSNSMSYAGDQFSYHHHHHQQQQRNSATVIGEITGTQSFSSDGGDGMYKDALEVLENVTVHAPGSTKELMELIHTLEEEILIRNDEAMTSNSDGTGTATTTSTVPPKYPVGLLVLDSIAAPTRRDFGAESAIARVNAIFQIAQTLKRIADELQVAVVVVNQVGNLDEYGQGNAALGVSWHHCVSTRLQLDHELDPHRIVRSGDGHDETVGHVRIARVVKSNVAPPRKISFEVNAMGVCALGDNTDKIIFRPTSI